RAQLDRLVGAGARGPPAQGLDRQARAADDLEAHIRDVRRDRGQGLDQYVEPLVRADQAEEEDARLRLLRRRGDLRAGVQQRVRDDGDAAGRDAADLDEQAL